MAIIENLYPPIVMDTIPAFIRTETCKIYFSLSIYTSEKDIKNVQVSVVNQRTNISALRRDLYPSEIKLAHLQQDKTKKDNYNYYIQISPEDDLEAGTFEINQFYKVQLRFTSTLASNPPVNGKIATWLEENINHFSEWSKVCLIKGIAQPLIETNFDNKTEFDIAPTQFIGRLYYEQPQETEHLDNYTIKIYKSLESNKILYNSGIIHTDSFNPNEINYQILFDFQKQITYVLELSFETNNSYSGIRTYSFLINSTEVPEIPILITATPQEDYGCIDITLKSEENETFQGTLIVKRASSKTDFIIWDIIKTIEYENEQDVLLQFQDLSTESGVWYLYRVQGKLLSGAEKAPVQIPAPIICVFDDIYIVGDEVQLKIQFNPTVGDFKYNILESQQTTLGGQYPYTRINGKSKYRSFSLGGLISSLSNRTDWFKNDIENEEEDSQASINRRKMYGAVAAPLYEQYNKDNKVSDYLDILYEKAFREKVYDFLYSNKIKLFKSTTEGNILIRLSNVSFQPQETLGRGLYSFTATATEIDDATVKNYIKYGVIKDTIDLESVSSSPGQGGGH